MLPGTRGAAGAYAAGVPRVEGKHEPIVRRLFQAFSYPQRISPAIQDGVHFNRVARDQVINGEWESVGEHSVVTEVFLVDACVKKQRFDIG